MTAPAPAEMRDPPPGVRGLQGAAVRASWTAAFARLAGVSLGVALFLSLSGAFGMDPIPLWKRLAYWLGLLLFGSALSVAGQGWIQRGRGGALLLRGGGLAFGLTLVMTPVVFLATRLTFGGGWSWRELASFVTPVFVVSSAMTVLNVLTLQARRARAAEGAATAPGAASSTAAPLPPTAPSSPGPSPFMRRLPLKLRGAELYAVEAEDHYLRVHTDRGSDLLLMRLADALDELGPIEGARTHRSWWVARAAVVDARRGDGRATLVLKDGAEAPVSRSYAPALREAGWF